MTTNSISNLEEQLKDIRNQLSLNEDLLENKKRFLEISQKLPVAIIEMNNELKINYSNDIITQIFGYSFDEIENKSIANFIHPDDLSTVEEKIALINKGIISGPYEYRIFGSDGNVIKALILSSPIYTNNCLTGIKCCIIDSIQYKNLEEKTFKPESPQYKNKHNQAIKFSSLNQNEFNECHIEGKSILMQKLNNSINKVANLPTTVLIYGETGTGKEIIAKKIHQLSNRKYLPLVTVNCGAFPENLLESELFGYKKGAFTDAKADKKGLFEKSNGSTLFLDEIGEMPLNMQVKLLRVMQEKKVRPIGSSKEIDIDVRIIAATNKDLEQLVKDGKFREDLYYRINVVYLKIPPLKMRRDEILPLSNFFLKQFNALFSKNIKSISSDTQTMLSNYDFPGNVRELKHLMEFACIFCNSDTLDILDFPEDFKSKVLSPAPKFQYTSEDDEKSNIIKTLAEFDGNKSKTAKELGIHRTTLLRKLDKYKIKNEDLVSS